MSYDPVFAEIEETRRKLWDECDGTLEGYSRHCEEVAREFRARVAAEVERKRAEKRTYEEAQGDGGAEGELAGCGAVVVREGEAPNYQTAKLANRDSDLARKGEKEE